VVPRAGLDVAANRKIAASADNKTLFDQYEPKLNTLDKFQCRPPSITVNFYEIHSVLLEMKHTWDRNDLENDCLLGCCASIIRIMIALTMEAVSTSETSVSFYQTIRRNVPEDVHLHTCRRENLKSH
jgi:hypothetical protein